MPSCRVRRNSANYASLSGDEGRPFSGSSFSKRRSRSRSHTATSAFRDSDLPSTAPSQGRPISTAATAGDGSVLREQYANRSLRPTSRIGEHISSTRASRLRDYRGSFSGQSSDPAATPRTSHEGQRTIEGAQADLRIPLEARESRVESALSLTSYGSGDTNGEHHEDDIVEHLDVIDPQVATMSNLANAANAIMIPPIGVYSRKPIVVLGRATDDGTETGTLHEDELDRHVEEVLTKRSKFRRTMKGVWSFLKTPMGVIVGIYGFLVVFWGTALVFFLAKWINFHSPVIQGFWVEVASQIENALFTVTGIGLLPWRVIDTYRIVRIWSYKRLTRKLRKKSGLPELYDEDDLPDPMYDPNYVHVLTDAQQEDLHYQQQMFMESQTWYRPHGTETHRAFPINTALLICAFVDGNSFFQCLLCGCMWGLNRFQRPAWTTGSLIPASFICGIVAAVLIWRGGQQTKRTKVVEEKLRLALKMEKDPRALSEFCDEIGSKLPPPAQSAMRKTRKSLETRQSIPSVVIEENMEVPNEVSPAPTFQNGNAQPQ